MRRRSSVDFPLNMGPVTSSIRPPRAIGKSIIADMASREEFLAVGSGGGTRLDSQDEWSAMISGYKRGDQSKHTRHPIKVPPRARFARVQTQGPKSVVMMLDGDRKSGKCHVATARNACAHGTSGGAKLGWLQRCRDGLVLPRACHCVGTACATRISVHACKRYGLVRWRACGCDCNLTSRHCEPTAQLAAPAAQPLNPGPHHPSETLENRLVGAAATKARRRASALPALPTSASYSVETLHLGLRPDSMATVRAVLIGVDLPRGYVMGIASGQASNASHSSRLVDVPHMLRTPAGPSWMQEAAVARLAGGFSSFGGDPLRRFPLATSLLQSNSACGCLLGRCCSLYSSARQHGIAV